MTLLERVVAVTGISADSPIAWVNGIVIALVVVFAMEILFGFIEMAGGRRV